VCDGEQRVIRVWFAPVKCRLEELDEAQLGVEPHENHTPVHAGEVGSELARVHGRASVKAPTRTCHPRREREAGGGGRAAADTKKAISDAKLALVDRLCTHGTHRQLISVYGAGVGPAEADCTDIRMKEQLQTTSPRANEWSRKRAHLCPRSDAVFRLPRYFQHAELVSSLETVSASLVVATEMP
jgi:hypothetical protein